MPTLDVSYSKGNLNISGGDGGGSDVTILYGQNATITWNRVGTNFKFLGLTFNPNSGPFSDLTINDGSISVLDSDNNTTGKDVQYQYSIQYQLTSGAVRTLDPKVINKSGSSMAMLTPMARRTTARKAKRQTRARR
jgi:hypothetical protein